jgi:Uma2 family endonuclease
MVLEEVLSIEKTKKLPRSLAARLRLPNEVRYALPLDDFLDFATLCEYKVEYHEGNIISILDMGQTTLTHEQIVANVIYLLNQIFFHSENHLVCGSNLGIYAPLSNSSYSPDVTVIEGASQEYELKRKKTTKVILNPYIVVEVLSDGTKDFDNFGKLDNYMAIPSVHYILYVEQKERRVRLFRRPKNGNEWLLRSANQAEESIEIEEKSIFLSDIYRKTS